MRLLAARWVLPGVKQPGASADGARPAPPASLAGVLVKRPQARVRAINPVPDAADPATIIAWWEILKRGRRLPAPADLDRAAIGAAWPAAVLLTYGAEPGGIASATRLGDRDDVRNGAVEYSAMLTEWLLATGRRALGRGLPLDETRDFPTTRGLVAYRILALPLSTDGQRPDHVLCRLARA
jgi:hypothetical protein